MLNAPNGFQARLEPLPAGVRFQKKADGAGVILAFFRTADELQRRLPELAGQMRAGRTLWLIWPKKASGVPTDLTERNVREMGLASGIVDYKICAVDETWSALAFAARKAKSSRAD